MLWVFITVALFSLVELLRPHLLPNHFEYNNVVIKTLQKHFFLFLFSTQQKTLSSMKKQFLSLILLLCFQLSSYGQTVVFEKTFGGSGNEQGWVVTQLPDSTYVIAGGTKSFGHPEGNFYLLKTGQDGNLIWDNNYGTERIEHCYAFTPTEDGGFLLGGLTREQGAYADHYTSSKQIRMVRCNGKKHMGIIILSMDLVSDKVLMEDISLLAIKM